MSSSTLACSGEAYFSARWARYRLVALEVFYGPGRTQGFTNSLVIDRLRAGKRPFVPVRDDRRRTLIWTPDASRGLAAPGNDPDAYGQTWHLPVDSEHPPYRDFVALASAAFGRKPSYTVVPKWVFSAAGLFSAPTREIRELLPRNEHDNIFDDAKFRARFTEFEITNYREGLGMIRGD